MGEDEQPQAPELQKAPPPPTATQLTDEAIANQRKTFNATLPQLGELGQELTNIQGRLLPQVNQLNLEQKRIFGPALVGLAMDMAKQADPQGFQLRSSLVEQVTKNLGQGGMLTPEEQRLAQEDIRSGQVNRGFGTGMSDVYDEARFLGAQRFNREQARIGNALNVLAGRDPGQAFMGLTGTVGQTQTPDVSGFAYSQNPNVTQLMGVGQNAWQQQAAASDYNNKMMMANFQNNQPQGGGGFNFGGGLSGGLSGAATGAAMGSVLPGMGTAIGAGAGGLLGFLGGGLSGRR